MTGGGTFLSQTSKKGEEIDKQSVKTKKEEQFEKQTTKQSIKSKKEEKLQEKQRKVVKIIGIREYKIIKINLNTITRKVRIKYVKIIAHKKIHVKMSRQEKNLINMNVEKFLKITELIIIDEEEDI